MLAQLSPLALAQLGLDALLLIALIILILRGFSKGRTRVEPPTEALRTTEEFLAASEKLTAELDNNLQEKRALIKDLIARLDAKTDEMRLLLDRADRLAARTPSAPARPAKPSQADPPDEDQRRRQVRRLADQGLDAGQIAARLHLPKSAVEVILSLGGR